MHGILTVLLTLLAAGGPPDPLAIAVARAEFVEKAAAAAREKARAEAAPDVPKEWLAARRAAFDRDVESLRPFVAHLRKTLLWQRVVDDDLRAFLDRPDAATRLYLVFLRPHLRRSPVALALGSVLAARDDGKLHIPGALRASAERRLAECEKREGSRASIRKLLTERYSEAGVEELREAGRAIARRMAPGDGLLGKWRDYLNGEGALVVAFLAPEPVRPSLVRTLLDQTRFGWCFTLGADGYLEVNRHAVAEMDALLAELTGISVPDDPVRAELAALRLKGREFPGDEPAELKLLARAEEIARELSAANSRIELRLSELEYDPAGIDLFLSSVFYNPRTAAGHYWYTTGFPDHPTARLFGTFGWTAKTTKSVEEFLAKIDRRLPALRALAKTHDRLIVIINTMPPWLAATKDRRTFEGGRRSNAEAHPPKDWEAWRKMVRGMVERLKTIEGVTWYYEFWNEPDLEYWQAGLGPFLRLYQETAMTIRAADPKAKVGGCAPNQWDGKIRRAKDRDPVNLELIRFSAREKVPLDFVSWHVFGRPVSSIAEAKERYGEELRKAGVTTMPEFLVTEWSVPNRNSPYAAVGLAELMLGFREAAVDAQTVACWEEFHAKPDPKHFAPWGLITQQGHRKPSYYAHRFFDRIARDSTGVAVVKSSDGWTVVASRKPNAVYDLLLWRRGLDPRFAAALMVLQEGGLTREIGRRFGSYDRLKRAITEGRPVPPGLETAFGRAREVFLEHPVRTPRLVLEFGGAKEVEVLFAESVRMSHRVRRPVALQNRVTLPLAPYEMLRITLRVR